jgi:hypothetical protein
MSTTSPSPSALLFLIRRAAVLGAGMHCIHPENRQAAAKLILHSKRIRTMIEVVLCEGY